MPLRVWTALSEPLPGAPGLRALTVSEDQWRRVAEDMAAAGGRLLALWASGNERITPTVHAAFLSDRAGLVVTLSIDDTETPYPGLEDLFPAAARMQRAMADLSGVRSTDSDSRPWLRHAAWPASYRPLIDPPSLATTTELTTDSYEFVRVEGDGVHEIAVGPRARRHH